jgi:uncharacterized protein YbbC (DUF1343 family)/CubicO group peptidase (beta-lactamase class C family)
MGHMAAPWRRTGALRNVRFTLWRPISFKSIPLLMKSALFFGLFISSVALGAQDQQQAFRDLDLQINDAIRTGLIPGAVVLVGRNDQVLYRKAYGSRSILPRREAMTVDTIFDIASLTKVVATTPCIMKLFEAGKLRLDDPVTNYLPEFQGGKSDITVRLLMTHFSGLPPDVELVPKWSGYQTGIELAVRTNPVAPPGAEFIYSDINFILLGEIVHRLSGKMLPEFAHEQIFLPLGMNETEFQPPARLRPRIAPTEINKDTGQPMRGIVDDPTSRYMGGVAGHAGLFSTADDLAKYAEMMLGLGQRQGVHLFQPMIVQKFTEPASPADQPMIRALGWDMDTRFSSNRGELYPVGSYGHTGYTGTEMWLDPTSKSFVILLTNSGHPNGPKSINSLRSRVSTIVAASFGLTVPDSVSLTSYNETLGNAGVHRVINRDVATNTGLDVLEANNFAGLTGHRVGLITNPTGVDRAGRRNVDTMLAAGVRVTKLFSPEHGIGGSEDGDVASGSDAKTGLPVVSLYVSPQSRRPTDEQLRDVDMLVFDMQDVGARFYTYSCTLVYALEAAAKFKKPFFVLDRPNPITGTHIEGPMLDAGLESFVGCYNLPVRHGMTFGELATMANDEQHWNADLHVIRMSNWQRGDWFDSGTLAWVNPSPNIRSLNAALLYPGIAMLEANTNYSVGRGTDAPFEQVGAEWMDGKLLAYYLNSQFIPGVRVYATSFRPVSSNLAGKEISGVRFVITDRESFDSTRLGIELAAALQKLFPGKIDFDKCRNLIGSREIVEYLTTGRDASFIWSKAQRQANDFAQRRKMYLLY